MKKKARSRPQLQPPSPMVSVPTSSAPKIPEGESEPRQNETRAATVLKPKAENSLRIIRALAAGQASPDGKHQGDQRGYLHQKACGPKQVGQNRLVPVAVEGKAQEAVEEPGQQREEGEQEEAARRHDTSRNVIACLNPDLQR